MRAGPQLGSSNDLRGWNKLDRLLEVHIRCHWQKWGEGMVHTYPSEKQGHLKHEMGGEYDQEVPHRILCDGPQKARNFEFLCLRL